MIAVNITSGLGNNMFQYAAGRVIAETNGYHFIHKQARHHRFKKSRLKLLVKEILLRPSQLQHKQLSQKDLVEYFELGCSNKWTIHLKRLVWILTFVKRKIVVSPRRKVFRDQYQFEIFDNRVLIIKDWCLLNGSFQSSAYFNERRGDVLQWFKLRKKYKKRLISLSKKIDTSPSELCCLHVRRGDYLLQNKGLGLPGLGWCLPIEYYIEAAKKLPKNTKFIIVTDDVEYASKNLNFLPIFHISTENNEAVDMHLFGLCKYNIIANSSFSWWGAWLNQQEEKVVIAPKNHIGWSVGVNIPFSFDSCVDDWVYIDIPKLL